MLVRPWLAPLALLAACSASPPADPSDPDPTDTDPRADTEPPADTDPADDTDPGDAQPADTDGPQAAECVPPVPASVGTPDPRAVRAGEAEVDALVADLHTWAAAVHRAGAGALEGPNRLVSPVSLATFATVVASDADATLTAALDDALAPGQALAAYRATLARWLGDLPAPPAQRHAVVQHALALFHRGSVGPRFTASAVDFGVSLIPRSFDDPEAARVAINAWTREHTACLIPELFAPETFSTRTRFTLVDALAVVADWAAPFDPEGTADVPFTLADGTRVDVPTMRGEISGAATGTWGDVTVLRLALEDPTLAFYAAVPAEPSGLEALEASLDGPALAAILASPRPRGSVWVELPKLALFSMPDTPALLAAAGLGALNHGTLGDLCDGCALDRVVHAATLQVDEAGLRAAAATGGVGVDSGTLPTTMLVDRPFLVVVRDEAAGAVLFVGRVGDPRAP